MINRITGYVFYFILGSLALFVSTWSSAANLHISTENTSRHFQTRHLELFAAELSRRLESHNVALIDSAEAYRDRDLVVALSSGKIAMGAPGIWHIGRFVPDVNSLLLPIFMGKTGNELYRFVDGNLGAELNKQMEEKLDVIILGRWLDLGPAHLFTTKAPINKFSDLSGLAIRYAGGAGNAETLQRLGAEPILIPWPNVPHALDRNQIEGLLTTASTVVSAQLWNNGIAHGFLSHSYYPFYIPMMSRKTWVRLSEQEQLIVKETWEELLPQGRDLAIQDQQTSLQVLRDAGISIVSPDAAQRERISLELLADQQEIADILTISDHIFSLIPSSQFSEKD